MKMIKVEKCWWCGSQKLQQVAERKDGIGVQECQNCKLLLVTEVPEDLSFYYEEENYFNPEGETKTGYHENYDLLSPFYLYWQGALIEEVARVGHKHSLLEIGCATGNALEMIRELNHNVSVFGIDLSPYAIQVCKEKGLDAAVSTIEDFKPSQKYDMIFSAETMEHVDNLHIFIDSVKRNLEKQGVFIFYIPAVDREILIEQSRDYPSLTTSLEHVSYFTQSFLQSALRQSMDAHVTLHRMSSAGENYHLGVVSKDKALVDHLKQFINGTMEYEPAIDDPKSLYNLTVIAAKFAKFDIAIQYLDKLKQSDISKEKIDFVQGALGYGRGELLKARHYFQSYLAVEPTSRIGLKALLANERELSDLYAGENSAVKATVNELENRVMNAETKLKDYRQSKIIGSAIKARRIIGATLDPVRRLRGRVKARLIRLVKQALPPVIRRPIKYMVELQWLVKRRVISNQKHPANQPLVSVVIAFYNAGLTIDETLDSLRSQTFMNFEVIIVNDGSQEQASAEKFAHLDANGLDLKKLQHPKNKGPAYARNRGIKIAKGRYIICLDADDLLEPTYIEKGVVVMETTPSISLVSTDMRMFGVRNSVYRQAPYNPVELPSNNMMISSSMFKKEGWSEAGGYKSGLGYEDWELWLSMAEHGYWGKRIPEVLFNWRTAVSSRYIGDQSEHKKNLRKISAAHPHYQHKIRQQRRYKHFNVDSIAQDSLYTNLNRSTVYLRAENKYPNVLISVPWMTFGGAETLIYNYCRELTNDYNISFVTGLESEHEWEYKFKEITPNVYHLANLFDDKSLYLGFVSNYIQTRNIDILHIIHNGYMFAMLPELKRRHPKLKVVVTMFNDWVEYFQQSIDAQADIDGYVSDNEAVAKHYRQTVTDDKPVTVIPNGIDCYSVFNQKLFDRKQEREELGIAENDVAVFFIGRMSEEKNPDVFLAASKKLLHEKHLPHLKFLMIGDGPMGSELQKTIVNIDSQDIKYLGYKPTPEVARCLSAADIFVLPSRIEGFPLSVLEAMSMQLAVIASRVGAVPDVIDPGQNGYIITPGSASEIAETIAMLHDDRSQLAAIKARAREKVEEKYSNRILGRNYIKMYKGVLK